MGPAGGRTGLELHALLQDAGASLPTVILTADRDAGLRQRISADGVLLLYKPLKPLALHQALQRLRLADVKA